MAKSESLPDQSETPVEYVSNQKHSLACVKWEGDIQDAIPVGFTRLHVPDDVEPRTETIHGETYCLTIFDRELEFAQFPIKAVNEDGTVELGPAIPYKVPKEKSAS